MYFINQFYGPSGSLTTHLTDFSQFIMIITRWEVILHFWCHFVDRIQDATCTYLVISRWAEWVVYDPISVFIKIKSHTVSAMCFYVMLQFLFYPNVFVLEIIAEKRDGSFTTRTSGSYTPIAVSLKVNEIQISFFGYLILAVKWPSVLNGIKIDKL